MTQTVNMVIEQPQRGAPLKERLEAFSMPVTEAGCWIWLKECNHDGYGQIRVNGRNCRAHRMAYEVFVGPIPEKMQVLHRCDTPACINPEHLFIGTNADNMADKAKKGRARHSQNHPKAVLTDQQVTEIVKDLRYSNLTQYLIGFKYGIPATTVSKINLGKMWARQTGATAFNPIRVKHKKHYDKHPEPSLKTRGKVTWDESLGDLGPYTLDLTSVEKEWNTLSDEAKERLDQIDRATRYNRDPYGNLLSGKKF